MPSIEIICVDQNRPGDFSDMPFAVVAEDRLLSHRTPWSLFQSDFDALKGCIYHLGGPHLKGGREGFFTAGDLLIDLGDPLRFRPDFAPHIRFMLALLLTMSPPGRLVFTSDYQFGPTVDRHLQSLALDEFWNPHDEGALRLNKLYPIHQSGA